MTVRRTPTLFPYRGKWRVTFVDQHGTTRSKALATKTDGYRFIAQLENPAGDLTLSQVMPTLAEWLTMWAEERSGNLRIKTMRTNISLINCHVIPTLGSYRLNQLSVSVIESLYRELLERKNLSPNSVQRIHAALTVPLQGALREGIISANPMAHVVKPRAPKPKMSPLTVQHRDLVWAAIRGLGASDQLRWTLALKYGLRQSEALGLQREDYDDYSQVLSIKRQVQRIPHQGWVFTPPKSAQGIRDIPVDDYTATLIKEVIEQLPEDCDLLFPDPNGNPRHASTDRKVWLRLLKNAGVPEVSLHTARHTAATVMITSGVDVKTVQIVLGHSTPSFTLATYVHPSVDDVRRSLRHIF